MLMKEEERERGNKERKINKDTNTLNHVPRKSKCKIKMTIIAKARSAEIYSIILLL